VIGIDVVDLGGWASLVVLAAVGCGVAIWLALLVWRLAALCLRWTRQHRPVT